MVVRTAGVGGSLLVDQRTRPRGVPTHTRPDAAAKQLTGRESEKLRTRTEEPVLAAVVFTPEVDGPQAV